MSQQLAPSCPVYSLTSIQLPTTNKIRLNSANSCRSDHVSWRLHQQMGAGVCSWPTRKAFPVGPAAPLIGTAEFSCYC